MSLLHRTQILREIREKLSMITTYVRLSNSQMLMDRNLDLEDFYCSLLNIVLDLNLENLSRVNSSYADIDLGDQEGGVCVQITSTNSRRKIEDILEKFIAYDMDRYFNRLIVLIVGERSVFRKRFLLKRQFPFYPERDVWGTAELMSQIEALDDDRLMQVLSYFHEALDFVNRRPALHLPVSTSLPSNDFVGREMELAMIEQKIISGENPVILSGIAGIGKTKLACHFARRYDAGNVYFVRFQESFRKTLATGVAVGLSGLPDDATEEDAYRMALHQLSLCGSNDILIIDGVDDNRSTLQKLMADVAYMELKTMKLRLILTTRFNTERAILVHSMPNINLYQIFEMHGVSLETSQMDELIKAVNGHTLIIVLMAQLLANSKSPVTPEEMSQTLHEVNLIEANHWEIGSDYNESPDQANIYQYLRVMFDTTHIPDESKYVLCCATLLPTDGVNIEYFVKALTASQRHELNNLVDNGWLTVENKQLTIHPVVRLVCREALTPSEECCGEFLDRLWEQYDFRTYNQSRFAQMAEIFANAVEIATDIETKAAWLNHCGRLYENLMQPHKAMSLYKKYLPELEARLPTHTVLATVYNSIGYTYGNLGDHSKALEYLLKALSICERLLPPEHLDRASIYNNVGSTYGALGDHSKALEYQLKALAIREKLLLPDHPHLASSYNNVGGTYSYLGDYNKALEYQLKDLAICEKILPPEHPNLAQSYCNVGLTYSALGDHQKALACQAKALVIFEKVLPPDHPHLATSYHNAGIAYSALGDHKEALEYKLKALAIREKVLPQEHPDLATSYNNIGITYANLSQLSNAEKYLKKALAIREKTLPEGHPNLLSSYRNLSAVYSALGDRDKALEYTLLSHFLPNEQPQSSTSQAAIDRELLQNNTAQKKWIPGTSHGSIEEMHIWASIKSWPDQKDAITAQYDLEEPGCYISQDGTQLLLLGASQEQIVSALHGYTSMQKLFIKYVEEVKLPVSRLTHLHELRLEYTNAEVILDQMHQQLRTVQISQGCLGNTSFLTRLPELWNLSLTALQGTLEIPDLTGSQKLFNLNLSDSAIVSLGALPNSIEYLGLGNTGLTQIPEPVKHLSNLKQLDLRGLHLQKLPIWLADLNLSACLDKPFTDHAILLVDTKVDGIDLSTIPPQKELLQEWLQAAFESKDELLNEIKVIFLGDGEAGKTHLIARLKKDGEKIALAEEKKAEKSKDNCGFNGNVTPGISITDHAIKIGNRTVKVHYWDFGGQEFLHAIHRIFMTKKTLYVVVLNARNDTQDHRAEFWLQNIYTVDQDAQVILVLNKVDQNPRASINENRLRRMYPSLKDVVKMSARDDSKEEMEKNLIRVIKERVENFETLNTPFPATWHSIRQKLEASPDPYITKRTFVKYCTEAGIFDPSVHEALKSRFSELGVSFACKGTTLLLKPEWVTNAIYKILFNRHDGVTNGIILIDDIEESLTRSKTDWTVDHCIEYNDTDVGYILDVMRIHKLSFEAESQVREFIPMLCERNESPLVEEYADDPFALEIRWVFDHLPDGLLYRLMVDRYGELDLENVWLSGARFQNWYTKSSAIVERNGNTLTFHIRSESPTASVQKYVDELESAIRVIINKEYPSFVESAQPGKVFSNGDQRRYAGFRRELVHKLKNSKETFSLDRLEADLNCQYYSTLLNTCIRSQDLLNQCYYGIDAELGLLIRDIVEGCRNIQGSAYIRENDRNTTIRNTLRGKDYHVYDQTLCGEGAGHNEAGELDMEIRKDPTTPWTIFEALNHSGPAYWKKHLDKLLKNYNAHGLKTLFLVAYIDDDDFNNIDELKSEENFEKVTGRYWKTLQTYSPEGCKCITSSCQDMSELYCPDSLGIKIFQCLYEDMDGKHTVYHLFVHVRKKRFRNK